MEKRCKGLVELDGPILEVFALFKENKLSSSEVLNLA